MRFSRKKEQEISIGIAPLIDIVFLLLIFFMVTSHFDVASGVRIRLPKVAQKLYSGQDNRITLVISKSGRTYLEGREIDSKALEKRLRELVDEKDLVHLVLQADKDVRHGLVVQTMDLAKGAGVHSIIIAANWKSDKVL
jgi:biopolymer transport protein ExbD